MSDDVQSMRDKYKSLLADYLTDSAESTLLAAYDCGCLALTGGLALLDLVVLHQELFLISLFDQPLRPEAGRLTKMANEFLLQALAPFEMANRSIAETNEKLRLFNQTLEERVAERTSELERQIQRLAALRTIDIAISSTFDMRTIMDTVLTQVVGQLGVDAADVLTVTPNTYTLQYSAGQGFRTAALQHTRLQIGQSYAGQAALERRTVHIPNLAAAEGFDRSPHLREEGFIAYYGVPLIARGEVVGVLEVFHRASLNPDPNWLNFLETLAGQAAIAIEGTKMLSRLQRLNMELGLAYDSTIEGWSRALDLRDKETEGHTLRVTETTLRLARSVIMNEEQLVQVRRGALLHDIGKMGIPDAVLLKPSPLTKKEWEVMRQHPVHAHELLRPIIYLWPAIDIPYCHHEKWDGTGYPRQLRGEQIPLAARLFAVVDVWDALHSDRPYRAAWDDEKTSEYIRREAGKHFDPLAVREFFSIV